MTKVSRKVVEGRLRRVTTVDAVFRVRRWATDLCDWSTGEFGLKDAIYAQVTVLPSASLSRGVICGGRSSVNGGEVCHFMVGQRHLQAAKQTAAKLATIFRACTAQGTGLLCTLYTTS